MTRLKATWEGELVVGGIKIRCYVCDDGKRYLNADDVHAFFENLGEIEITEEDTEKLARFIHLGET